VGNEKSLIKYASVSFRKKNSRNFTVEQSKNVLKYRIRDLINATRVRNARIKIISSQMKERNFTTIWQDTGKVLMVVSGLPIIGNKNNKNNKNFSFKQKKKIGNFTVV
jgi:hypothetical protein